MLSRVEKLLDLPYYTEGPAVDPDGNLFFTTLSGKKIMMLQPGVLRIWALGTCPNGQVILPNGEHWFCESSSGKITAYQPDGSLKKTIVENFCAGIEFTTPNDLIVDSRGNLFFTDSIRAHGKVLFKGVDGTEKLIADEIDYANGLCLNASENKLFVAESYGNRIIVLTLDENYQVRDRKTFVQLPQHPSGDPIKNLPDGLAIDREDRVWVAHYGMAAVHVISTAGEILYTIDTELPLTSNLTFIEDHADQKVLLVTGGYGEPGPGAVLKLTVNF